MSRMELVVADTTPLNYLILIGEAPILASLFGKVLIPEGVFVELGHPKAPDGVKSWIRDLPAWVQVVQVSETDATLPLGKGEVEAISLALEKRINVILMDERKGRQAAQSRGLLAVGTLNLIDLADDLGMLDGIEAIRALAKTTFRADPWLISQFEAKFRSRRG